MSERALWVAVIRQALDDACGCKYTIEPRLKQDTKSSMIRMARAYLNSPDFAAVCVMANLSPSFVRKRAAEVISHYDQTGEFICKLDNS